MFQWLQDISNSTHTQQNLNFNRNYLKCKKQFLCFANFTTRQSLVSTPYYYYSRVKPSLLLHEWEDISIALQRHTRLSQQHTAQCSQSATSSTEFSRMTFYGTSLAWDFTSLSSLTTTIHSPATYNFSTDCQTRGHSIQRKPLPMLTIPRSYQ